jgi:hypothetical protein
MPDRLLSDEVGVVRADKNTDILRFLVSLEGAIITAFNKRPVVLDCRVTSFADIQLKDNIDNFRLCQNIAMHIAP